MYLFIFTIARIMPIPVAARYKAWFCDRLLAWIAGLNLAGGMDICLLRMLCVGR